LRKGEEVAIERHRMAPLPREGITPGMEEEMKEWLERYRPVRQRTARSPQTTNDETGALPPAVYPVSTHWQRV